MAEDFNMCANATIKKCKNIKRRDLGSRLLLFSPDTNVLLEFNATAKFIWEICDERTLDEIKELYAKKYNIGKNDAERDVEDVINALKIKGCVN
jgi:hypothetical protein